MNNILQEGCSVGPKEQGRISAQTLTTLDQTYLINRLNTMCKLCFHIGVIPSPYSLEANFLVHVKGTIELPATKRQLQTPPLYCNSRSLQLCPQIYLSWNIQRSDPGKELLQQLLCLLTQLLDHIVVLPQSRPDNGVRKPAAVNKNTNTD